MSNKQPHEQQGSGDTRQHDGVAQLRASHQQEALNRGSQRAKQALPDRYIRHPSSKTRDI